MIRPPRQPARSPDRGQITAFLAPLVATFLAMAGLALDGGLAVAAQVRAQGHAQEAARAGAQAIDLAVWRSTGDLRLEPGRAHQLATDYLTAVATIDTATVATTTNSVTVTITAHHQTHLLHLVGLDRLTVAATGSAAPQPGITSPDSRQSGT